MWTYNYTKNQNELYHFGIIGQKWGIRRYQNPDGSLTSAGKKRYSKSEDAVRADLIRNKDISEMSNAELRTLNERIRLETEHKRINPSRIEIGKNVVISTLALIGTIATGAEAINKLIKNGKEIGTFAKKIKENT